MNLIFNCNIYKNFKEKNNIPNSLRLQVGKNV